MVEVCCHPRNTETRKTGEFYITISDFETALMRDIDAAHNLIVLGHNGIFDTRKRTFKELGKLCGKSPSTIAKMHKNAVQTIYEHYKRGHYHNYIKP